MQSKSFETFLYFPLTLLIENTNPAETPDGSVSNVLSNVALIQNCIITASYHHNQSESGLNDFKTEIDLVYRQTSFPEWTI